MSEIVGYVIEVSYVGAQEKETLLLEGLGGNNQIQIDLEKDVWVELPMNSLVRPYLSKMTNEQMVCGVYPEKVAEAVKANLALTSDDLQIRTVRHVHELTVTRLSND